MSRGPILFLSFLASFSEMFFTAFAFVRFAGNFAIGIVPAGVGVAGGFFGFCFCCLCWACLAFY